MPLGYHRFTLEVAGKTATSLLLSAPLRAYEPEGRSKACDWGVFLPLYALHSERSWGAGDFSDLEALTDWVTKLDGGMVATLPLLAAFLDEPFEPGPYSPASRLFWNEFYLDIFRIPELRQCRLSITTLQSAVAFRQTLLRLFRFFIFTGGDHPIADRYSLGCVGTRGAQPGNGAPGPPGGICHGILQRQLQHPWADRPSRDG